MSHLEMSFFAAMSAVGIYCSAYWLYSQVWDLVAKVVVKIKTSKAP